MKMETDKGVVLFGMNITLLAEVIEALFQVAVMTYLGICAVLLFLYIVLNEPLAVIGYILALSSVKVILEEWKGTLVEGDLYPLRRMGKNRGVFE